MSSPDHILGGGLTRAERRYAPKRLYVMGVPIPPESPRVAVAGTRRPSRRGVDLARGLADALARRRAIIVSGLAAGIDAISHQTAMDVGGRTVAVVGTPLDVSYPASNHALQAHISQNHTIISQFPAGCRVVPGNFALRNRTMALVSDAVIIIEAGDRTGTIHLMREALRLGRPLFVTELVAEARPAWLPGMLARGANTLDRYGDALAAAKLHAGRRRAARPRQDGDIRRYA